MPQLFIDKQFIPVIASVLTVMVILITRPSFFVRGSTDVGCPYCLNAWLVSLATLLVGGGVYLFINKDAKLPLNIYPS